MILYMMSELDIVLACLFQNYFVNIGLEGQNHFYFLVCHLLLKSNTLLSELDVTIKFHTTTCHTHDTIVGMEHHGP